ncbi:MAG TPA: hypothetical protein VGC35_14005 [Allosphingosinicella sp.]
MPFQCSSERPWGIHLPVRNDEDCPRCGWTAPGPAGDAVADAIAAARNAFAVAPDYFWLVSGGVQTPNEGQALAA